MSSTALLINDVKNKLLFSVGVVCLVFGTVGNLLNIFLFKRRALWKISPCIPFMVAASIANIISIYTVILIRILISFNITPTYYSPAACKLQMYLYYTSFSTSSWFMVGCCMDRFLSSSRNAGTRRHSNMRKTSQTIWILTIFFILLYTEVFYCYDANRFYAPAPCYPINYTCGIIDSCLFFICQYAGPPVLMLVLGFGTFIHIQQGSNMQEQSMTVATRNLTVVGQTVRNNPRRGNRTIIPMLIGQVILYILGSLPILGMRIYSLLGSALNRNDVRLAIENLVINMSLYCSLIDKIFSFYIYTLTSRHFRRELVKFFANCRSQPHVHPQDQA